MHRIVLAAVTAVTLFALVCGGRGEPVVPGYADAARGVCRGHVAMLATPPAPRLQLAASSQPDLQGRPLLVGYQRGGETAPAIPAAHRPASC